MTCAIGELHANGDKGTLAAPYLRSRRRKHWKNRCVGIIGLNWSEQGAHTSTLLGVAFVYWFEGKHHGHGLMAVIYHSPIHAWAKYHRGTNAVKGIDRHRQIRFE